MKKVLTLLLALPILIPNLGWAHGIGEVYALPIPLEFYIFGAGLAVAFSFFIIAFFVEKHTNAHSTDIRVEARSVETILKLARAILIILLLVTIVTGIFGSQIPTENFAPTFFWIYFLFGLGILSLLVGNIWEKLNPWRTISEWSSLVTSTRQATGLIGVIFLLGLFWLELSSGVSFVPGVLGLTLLVYTLINLIGARLYTNWYQDVEVFSVLFGFIGRLAHFKIGDDNKSVVVLNENKKLIGTTASWWTLGVASVLLAGTSFDSIKETALWAEWLRTLHLSTPSILGDTIGIILAPLPFLLFFFLAIWLMRRIVGKEYKTLTLARQFVYALIPIAFGYILAHNFSLFIVTAPKMLALISDPLGYGWDLFGTASFEQTTVLLGAKVVWFIEIGFVVLGHIWGVWYAHVLAVNIFSDEKEAFKSQFPMMFLMVGYTVLTLWLLSLPLTVSLADLKESIKRQESVRVPPMPESPIER